MSELGLDRVEAAGGLLDVDRDDGSVPWQASRRRGSGRPGWRVRAGHGCASLMPEAGWHKVTAGRGMPRRADTAVSRRLETVGACQWRLSAAEVARVDPASG